MTNSPGELQQTGGGPLPVPSHTAGHTAVTPRPEPRAAYVHVPFCLRRCGYCNFTVVAGRDDLIGTYIEALTIELAALECPRPVDTLFLGGGTPTHLPPLQLDALLALVGRWFPLAAGGEFSVEANPGDLDAERAAVLAAHGVTRITLGGQSFSPRKLTVLERLHSPEDIRASVELVRRFATSVGLDLILAAPDETLAEWDADLDAALALGIDHVSTYGLTFEKGTTFWGRRAAGRLNEDPEDLQRELYLRGIERLSDAGYEHYEVSNFARGGHRCRHNEVYWAAAEYWAAGPGAARYVDGRREVNHRSTTTWIRRLLAGQSPLAETEALGPEDRAREALVLSLRRIEGAGRAAFFERTGFTIDALFGAELAPLVERGLLVDDGRRVALSREGLPVSDAIWPRVLRR